MLDFAELQKIRAWCGRATPGRWIVSTGDCSIYNADLSVRIGRAELPQDAAFMGHARAAVPALLEYVGHLEARVCQRQRALHEQEGRIADLLALGVNKVDNADKNL